MIHYQFGGQCSVQDKPINILKRSNFLTIFSINYDQHSDFYNFYNSEQIIDNFSTVVENRFAPGKSVEVQVLFSLINFQSPENEFSVKILDKRAWMTDVFDCIFFNNYIRIGFRNEILKRVIVNGLTGSSWRFKRFNRIAINVKNKKLKSARICKMDFIQLFAGVDENDDDLNED